MPPTYVHIYIHICKTDLFAHLFLETQAYTLLYDFLISLNISSLYLQVNRLGSVIFSSVLMCSCNLLYNFTPVALYYSCLISFGSMIIFSILLTSDGLSLNFNYSMGITLRLFVEIWFIKHWNRRVVFFFLIILPITKYK